MADGQYSFPVQQLESETAPGVSQSEHCSAQLLDVVPLIMRHIRIATRHPAVPGISDHQLRCLRYLRDHPGASLSQLAEYLGLTMPSTSKLVQRLVTRDVVVRRVGADRRRVCLSLTEQGRISVALARGETRQELSESLHSLSHEELAKVSAAFMILRRVFLRGDVGVNIP